jgi:hypothetical protein
VNPLVAECFHSRLIRPSEIQRLINSCGTPAAADRAPKREDLPLAIETSGGMMRVLANQGGMAVARYGLDWRHCTRTTPCCFLRMLTRSWDLRPVAGSPNAIRDPGKYVWALERATGNYQGGRHQWR